jgi:hypothetical protein
MVIFRDSKFICEAGSPFTIKPPVKNSLNFRHPSGPVGNCGEGFFSRLLKSKVLGYTGAQENWTTIPLKDEKNLTSSNFYTADFACLIIWYDAN